MKIVIINSFESTGGAAKAAHRLFQSLRGQKDIEVKYLVSKKSSKDPDILCPWPIFPRLTATMLYLLDSFLVRFYPKRTPLIFSPSLNPTYLSSYINKLKPDIVHFHWITNGFIAIKDYVNIQCPIVWTLHDSWAFTGGCHLPLDCTKYENTCGDCPQLGSSHPDDLSQRIWKTKESAYPKLNLSVITPSRWLASCAQRSSLFKEQPIQIIPNGINLEIFCPKNRETQRKKLRLPEDKTLILISAMRIEKDVNKGLHFLDEIFKSLKSRGLNDLEFLLLGTEKTGKNCDHIFPLHYLGTLKDERAIARLYSSANLTLLLSRQENLPFSVMESLSCGTPVVAFNIGGIPDMVHHQSNGYLASLFSVEDITTGISWCLEDNNRYLQLCANSRKTCEDNFSLQQQKESYIELYRKTIPMARSKE